MQNVMSTKYTFLFYTAPTVCVQCWKKFVNNVNYANYVHNFFVRANVRHLRNVRLCTTNKRLT